MEHPPRAVPGPGCQAGDSKHGHPTVPHPPQARVDTGHHSHPTARPLQPLRLLTNVMIPMRSRSCAALRELSLGVERPLSGGDELARDRAVREVGMEALLHSWVRFSPSMLPLVTRVSSSSARSSVDSFSSWIILGEQRGSGLLAPHLPQGHRISVLGKCTLVLCLNPPQSPGVAARCISGSIKNRAETHPDSF